MNVRDQVIKDAKSLNDQLKRLGVGASIDPKRCNPGGDQLAFYGLKLHGKTRAADIANDKIMPELVRAISQSRGKRTHLRFDDIALRLEAEHPARQPLQWLPSIMRRTQPHTAALGISHHDGEQTVTVSLEDIPQILVAGETGSGKTVLLRNFITSLCYATPPSDLRIVLVDPKNEDLAPYKTLPHVIMFAGTPDAVDKAINFVAAEIHQRTVNPNGKRYRLLLIVDELAQLVNINGAIKKLGDIMSIGRSKLVNCVVCTQQPTEQGGMGGMMRANVPLRLIGAVSAGQSFTATRRRGAGADMLPGNGSFLFIKSLDILRFQCFFLDGLSERHAVAMIGQKWGSTTFASTTRTDSTSTGVVEPSRTPVVEAKVEEKVEAEPPAEPLTGARVVRDEIDGIASQIRQLWLDQASKNAMCKHVFSRPYAGSYAAKIDAAIDRLKAEGTETKIIKLRRTGTGG